MHFKDPNIPKQFYSYLSEKPIENCIMCEKNLMDEFTVYFIEKAIRNGEVEFEYAICMDCAAKMRGSMSKESVANMESYFKNNSQIQEYQNLIFENDELSVDQFLSNCVVKGTPVSEIKEYQFVGVFQGKHIYPYSVPFLISNEASEEINDLLSKQTKGEMDNFIDDFIGVPPEWREIIKTNKPVLI